MRDVSDAFLLNMAEVSSALVGLFLVGVFFYVETGFRRSGGATNIVEPYFEAATRIVLILYAIPIFLSLALVVLEPVWSRVLFAVLSLLLIAANVDTAIRMRAVAKVTTSNLLVANEAVGTISVLALVVTPWLLGGLEPSREDLTWAILLSFGAGFLSVSTMALSAFDVAKAEIAGATDSKPRRFRRRRRVLR
jgi:hypothetical protein